MRIIIKEVMISIFLTLMFIFFLAVLVSQTSFSENMINPVVVGITSISLLMGAFRVSKYKKEKGILNGIIVVVIYMAILYLISSFISLDFSLSINSIIMILVGIIGGIIGGILGVNL